MRYSREVYEMLQKKYIPETWNPGRGWGGREGKYLKKRRVEDQQAGKNRLACKTAAYREVEKAEVMRYWESVCWRSRMTG